MSAAERNRDGSLRSARLPFVLQNDWHMQAATECPGLRSAMARFALILSP